jgi:hypothetical protein
MDSKKCEGISDPHTPGFIEASGVSGLVELGLALSRKIRILSASPLKFLKAIPCVWLLLLLLAFFPQNPNIMQKQFFYGTLFSAIILSIVISEVTHLSLGILFLYVVISSTKLSALYAGGAGIMNNLAATSTVYLLFAILPALLVARTTLREMLDGISILGILVSAYMILLKCTGEVPYSFMNNSAADASLLAVLYPVMVFRPAKLLTRWSAPLFVFLPPIAIAVCGSTTAIVALAVSLFAVWGVNIKAKRMKIIDAGGGLLSTVIFGVALLGVFFMKDQFLGDNGRFNTWQTTMGAWWNNWPSGLIEQGVPAPNHWFGTGAGSFYVLGPIIELINKFPTNTLFANMHNEYLQILFEYGYIGLSLFLVAAFYTLRKSFDRPWLSASLFTYGFVCLTQFHFRFFLSALIVAFLVREAYEGETAKTEN